MKLTYEGIRDAAAWERAGVKLPGHDIGAMLAETEKAPVWVHFGAGNIFRGFIAGLAQRLLDAGEMKAGIVAAETFDGEVIEKIYKPFDSMALAVSLNGDGTMGAAVQASIARGLYVGKDGDWEILKGIFMNPSLQMVSFTITEKGYALKDIKGDITPAARADMDKGPARPGHAMGAVAALLYERYLCGGAPVAMVSMDNCSRNGEKLRAGVTEMAESWEKAGLVSDGFVKWLEDESRVSFPWSMIDKITPRPSQAVADMLEKRGVEDMAAVTTAKHTYIAPFVNAEAPQYLVIEDRFPGGRPPLEKAGVYMTDRETVNRTERMKVTTCLNPLHTALAVFGCLMGYEKICDEMKDELLVALVRRIGYVEGLPVVTDPGILDPRAFIDEVVGERLPNPFMPDTPQRIATDTSQKIPVRFGETIKSYMADPKLDTASLTAIPLAIAGWLRYALGVDDEGREMALSPDPMLDMLRGAMAEVRFKDPDSARGEKVRALMGNSLLFGVSLEEAGLADKVLDDLARMLEGPGAVRRTLKEVLA